MRRVDVEQHQPVVLGFDGFYSSNVDRVYRALALVLRDPDLANDAVAEAMALAFERWETVSQYQNPSGWVFKVGLNWARSRFRRRAREVLALIETPVPSTEPFDPGLLQAVASLPIGHRKVVVLRYFLDWSERDIASALGIRPGTVKSRLSRALATLRKEWQ